MEQSVQFDYQGIVAEQFAVYPENYQPTGEASFQLTATFPYNYGKRTIGCQLVLDLSHPDQVPFLRCAITCVFEIHEESWSGFKQTHQEAVELPKSAFVHFTAFTAGTLRGVLHVRQQTSPVNALLPPVNVFQLLEDLTDGERILRPSTQDEPPATTV